MRGLSTDTPKVRRHHADIVTIRSANPAIGRSKSIERSYVTFN